MIQDNLRQARLKVDMEELMVDTLKTDAGHKKN